MNTLLVCYFYHALLLYWEIDNIYPDIKLAIFENMLLCFQFSDLTSNVKYDIHCSKGQTADPYVLVLSIY